MTNFIRFRSMLVAASLLAGAAACDQKSETRREADRAAEAVKDQVEDLKGESRDLAETAKDKADRDVNAVDEVVRGTDEKIMERTANDGRDSVGEVSAYVGEKAGVAREQVAEDTDDIADEAKDVGKNARQLADASNEFKYRKMVRIQTLRAVHAVEASQPMLINAFAQGFPLVEKDRGEVNEKLVIFQMRLDEAGNAIQSLELVEAKDWEDRNDAVSKALERVEDAREDVWEELKDADRVGDRTSMR
jgi:hypothetical protein